MLLAFVQWTVHPRSLATAVSSDAQAWQNIQVLWIDLVPREHQTRQPDSLFACQGNGGLQIGGECRFAVARLKATIVREGVGCDLLTGP